MRIARIISAASMVIGAFTLGACGDTTSTTDGSVVKTDMAVAPDMTQVGGFKQPAGTAAVSFTVDDTANKVYAQGDLQWKGSMIYDPTTRLITKDSMWGGPWAPLYDDGPWDQGNPPGHEPKGSTAGDHKWGVTVFATPPAMGDDTYEYGLNDDVYQKAFGNGWVWSGSNGTFKVSAGKTDAITAQGQTFAKFGTTDIQLVIDSTKIDMMGAWDTSKIGVKGSAWAWGTQTLTQDMGKTTYTFTLSGVTGMGKQFSHTGLSSSGDKPEFIFVFGSGMTPKEYKDAGGTALPTGITAAVKAAGAMAWTTVPITIAGNKNTTITIP